MKGVRVQFIGSGDAFGSGGRYQTCIYVQFNEAGFLIDCGASSLIGMRRFSVDPSLIDIILITHLHGDHFGGIPFFILDAHLISRRTRPLIVAGPPGLEARIREGMEVFFPGSSKNEYKFTIEFVELTENAATRIRSLEVMPFKVAHPSGASPYALRIKCGGKIIAYSGDTEWTGNLIQAAKGTDLFICEAYFFEKKIPFHLNYQTLLKHKAELGCRRLILTHMSDDMLGRLQALEIEGAEDGQCIVL
jgi:ribonuclease BN (tRNA processing enzyme)